MPTTAAIPLSKFLDDAGEELLWRLNGSGANGLPFEVVNRLEELGRELRSAAFQVRRKEQP